MAIAVREGKNAYGYYDLFADSVSDLPTTFPFTDCNGFTVERILHGQEALVVDASTTQAKFYNATTNEWWPK